MHTKLLTAIQALNALRLDAKSRKTVEGSEMASYCHDTLEWLLNEAGRRLCEDCGCVFEPGLDADCLCEKCADEADADMETREDLADFYDRRR